MDSKHLPLLFTITIYYMKIVYVAIIRSALIPYQKLWKAMSIQHICVDFLEMKLNR